MKTTTVKQKVHIVEYYKDNELMKSIDLAEVIDERKYWENLKSSFSILKGFVELPNFTIISKCYQGDYDFTISKIIERITN
jgi:hypothetical protein